MKLKAIVYVHRLILCALFALAANTKPLFASELGDSLLRSHSNILPPDTYPTSLELFLDNLLLEARQKSPSAESFELLTASGKRKVEVDFDSHPDLTSMNPYGIYTNFGLDETLGEGANKLVKTTVEFGTWRLAAKATLLHPERETDRAIFQREQKIAQLLDKKKIPGLIEVYAVTQDAIILKRYPMTARTALLGSKSRNIAPLNLTDHQKLTLLSQAIEGLLYLKTLNYAHRDVKLENMLVSSAELVLSDFGFAIESDEWLNKNGKSWAGTYGRVPLDQIASSFSGSQNSSELKLETLFAADTFAMSVSIAEVLRPELVRWTKACLPPPREEAADIVKHYQEQYQSCLTRFVLQNVEMNNKRVYRDKLSLLLLRGLDPVPHNRISLEQLNQGIQDYMQTHPNPPTEEERQREEKPRLQAYLNNQIDLINLFWVKDKQKELKQLFIQHRNKVNFLKASPDSRNVSLAEMNQILPHLIKEIPDAFLPKEDQKGDKAFQLIALKSGLFKKKFRIGALINTAQGPRRVKFYLDLKQSHPDALFNSVVEEIEYYLNFSTSQGDVKLAVQVATQERVKALKADLGMF